MDTTRPDPGTRTLRVALDAPDAARRASLSAMLHEAGWQVLDADGSADGGADAVLLDRAEPGALAALAADPALPARALDRALVVLAPSPAEADEAALVAAGVEAVLDAGAAADVNRLLVPALRQAIGRKRLEHAARRAYATDLATGLPHHDQLIEHLTQLIALREREPAPMVLLVLQLSGVDAAAARAGAEAAQLLRRKVAVRLRAGLRASDVVAALGADAYAVLLGRLDAKRDGERVAAKLVRALEAPVPVSGQGLRVGVAVGLAIYPDHGRDARALLARAMAQARSAGTGAVAAQVMRVRREDGAANEPR